MLLRKVKILNFPKPSSSQQRAEIQESSSVIIDATHDETPNECTFRHDYEQYANICTYYDGDNTQRGFLTKVFALDLIYMLRMHKDGITWLTGLPIPNIDQEIIVEIEYYNGMNDPVLKRYFAEIYKARFRSQSIAQFKASTGLWEIVEMVDNSPEEMQSDDPKVITSLLFSYASTASQRQFIRISTAEISRIFLHKDVREENIFKTDAFRSFNATTYVRLFTLFSSYLDVASFQQMLSSCLSIWKLRLPRSDHVGNTDVIKNISVKDVAGDDTYDDRIDARLVFHTSSTELSFEDLVRMGGQSGNAAEYAHFIMSAMLMLLSCIVQYTKDSKSFTIFVDNFDSFVFPQKSTRPSFLGTLAYFLNGTKSQVVSVVPSNEYLNMLITTNRPVVKLCVDNKGSGLTGIHAYSSES